MVPDIITGNSIFSDSNSHFIAKIAAFAFNVSKIVSTIIKSTPPLINPRVASRYATTNLSNETLRKAGSLTSGDMDAVLFVGPKTPAT